MVVGAPDLIAFCVLLRQCARLTHFLLHVNTDCMWFALGSLMSRSNGRPLQARYPKRLLEAITGT